MVAIVSGNGLGLMNGSAGTLGQSGLFGNSNYGSAKEAAYVNAATGNLIVSDRDEWLASVGIDVALTRTYNSLGNLSSGNGLNWQTGPAKFISGLTGTLNSAGSTVTRTDSDGSTQLYTYNATRAVYLSTDGGGAHDVLVGTAAGWTWQGERFDKSGTFETYDASGRITGIGANDVNRISYTYNGAGQLDTVTDASGDVSKYEYENARLARIRTEVKYGGSRVRTHYEYDDLGRLKAAIVDMTPEDGSVVDGYVYRTSYEYFGSGNQLRQLKQADGTEQNFTYAPDGKVETVTDALGRTTRFDYGTPGRTTVTDPSGAATTYGYDTKGQLTSVTAPAVAGVSQVTSLYYDDAGNLIRTVDTLGQQTVYGYDANGNRTLERDATGKTITRVYDLATNLLASETTYAVADPDGASALLPSEPMTQRYFYDAGKLLRFVVSAEGRTKEYRYLQSQLAAEIEYDRVPTPAECASAATLTTWSMAATTLAQVSTRKDYQRDNRGNVVFANTYDKISNGVGVFLSKSTRNYFFDSVGRPIGFLDAGKSAINSAYYDELGRIMLESDSSGTTRSSLYDNARGTMTVTTSADSTVSIVYTYDKAGQLTSVTQSHDSVSGTTQNYYDANGRLRMSRDPMGLLTHVLYDAAGRKVASIANKSLTEYVYRQDGLLLNTISYALDIDPAKLVDAAGKPLAVTLDTIRPAANLGDRKTLNGYDAAGRLIATVDAMGYLTRMEYDGAGRLVRTIARAKALDATALAGNTILPAFAAEASPDDRTTRLFYDRDGNVTAKLDASGYLTENVYNAAGDLSKTVTRLGIVAEALRQNGTLAQLQTSAGADSATQRFIYDGKGQLVGSIDAAGYLTEMTYDKGGNVLTRRRYAIPVNAPDAGALATVGKSVNAADRMTTYTYTALNQVASETTLGGDFVRYTYDANGKQTSVTRGTASVAERTALRRYDGIGQLTAELSEEGAAKIAALGATPDADAVARIWATYAVRYTYDLDGNRTSMTDVLGNRTLYVYREGRLGAVVNAVGDWEARMYDAFGDLIQVSRYKTPLNETQINAVAASGRLEDLPTSGPAFYTKYFYDNEGRQVYTAEADGAVRKNVYDAFDQVTQTLQYRTRTLVMGSVMLNRGHYMAGRTYLGAAMNGSASTTRACYDATGHLIYTVDATNAVEGRTYDAQGNVKSVTRFDTRTGELAGTSASVDVATLAALAQAGRDRTQTFTYDLRGLVLDSTDAAGFHTVSHFNAFGELDRATRYGVAGGTVSSVLDAVTQTFYDLNGRVKATVDGIGTVTTFAYDGDGHITEKITFARLTDPNASESTILAAIANQSLSHTALDMRQRFVYDANGCLTATLTLQLDGARTNAADPSTSAGTWNVVTQSYDAAGRVTQRTGFATAFKSTSLKPTANAVNNWIAASTTASDTDSIVRYAYDAAGRVTGTATAQRVVAGLREWSIVQVQYGANGNVDSRIQRAATLRSASPTAAEIAAFNVAAPAGSYDATVYYNYDAMGRVAATATALNSVAGVMQWAIATRTYDAAGNLITTRQFANAYTGNTPPAVLKGAVTADNGNDRLTRYSYDGANRLVATVDANGSVTRLDYDASGNVIKSTQYSTPLAGTDDLPTDYRPAGATAGRITRTFYDLNSRPAIVIGAAGAATMRTFDAAGNVTSELAFATPVTAAEVTDKSTLDSVRTLLLNKASAADRKQYSVYDADNRLRWTIDALGNLRENQYDTLGRLVYERTFATQVSIVPNATDMQVAETAAKAADAQRAATTTRTTTYVFNAAGNLESVTDALGKTERYTYDALGHKRSFTNKLGATWTYEYDAAGRLVTETSPYVGTYADGLAASLANWGPAALQALVTRMEYDALGNLLRRTEAAGIAGKERVTEYRYDALGRQVATIQPSLDVYDAGRKIDSVWIEHGLTEAPSGSRVVTVRYDALGNAVSNIDVGGRASYKAYDTAGHVRFEIDAARHVTEYSYDVYGQVASMTRYANPVPASATDLATIDDTDVARLLTRSAGEDRTITYRYDAAGRKIRTSEPVVATYDSHSTAGSPYLSAGRTTVSEYNAFGEVFRQSVFGADSAGTQITEAAVTRFYYNVRGEKTGRIDALSDIGGHRRGYLTTYAYDAAGNLTDQTEFVTEFGTWTDKTYLELAASGKDRKVSYTYDALNRKKTETRVNVTFAGSTNDVNYLTTSFDYDALGNQTLVTDAAGGKTFTYYNELGHVRAVAHQGTASDESTTPRIKLTEFKVDIHGNVVLRIDYADAAAAADGTGYTVTQPMTQNAANRITATRYDNWGRALETLDPEQFMTGRKSTKMSYDIYGRMAKQWRTVTNVFGTPMTSFQVIAYDAVGQVQTVTTPGLIDLVKNTTGDPNQRQTAYNAFGEVTATWLVADPDHTKVYSKYDQAGHAWLSNSDKGVHTVRLHDVHGNVTAAIQSAGNAVDEFKDFTAASQALDTDNVLRTENRYDLLNHMVDSRVAPDSRVMLLVRENEAWVRKTLPRGTGMAGGLLVVGDASDGAMGVAVRYRVGGGAWTQADVQRLRIIDGVTVFDTAGLAAGDYEYEVSVTPAGEAPFVRLAGQLRITHPVDANKDLEIIKVYLMMFNRAADMSGLNFWLDSANKGVGTAAVIASMLLDKEAGDRLNGTAAEVINKIFREAFTATQVPNDDSPERIAHWVERYKAAIEADGKESGAQRGLVLADLLASVDKANNAGTRILNNRADAVRNYVVTQRGSDPKIGAELLQLAPARRDDALKLGTEQGTLERNRIALIEMYVALFGRAPDQSGLKFWTDSLAQGVSIEQAAEYMLTSPEAAQPWLYPSVGLTPQQYNEQLVNRAYTLSLGRAPGDKEMAGWLAKLNAGTINRGQFAAQFVNQVTKYTGTGTAPIADRNLFTNKVSVAYAVVVTAGGELPTAGSGTALLAGITSAATAQDAAYKALLAARAAVELAKTAKNAAGIAAAATPLEEIRRTIARLYMTLLGRVPEPNGMEYYVAIAPSTRAVWNDLTQGMLNGNEAKSLLGDGKSPDNATFVRRLYENALGTLPAGAALQQEMSDYVVRLGNGATRAEVAYEVATRMLSSPYLNPAEQAAESLLNNRTAVSLTAGLTLTLADTQTQRAVLSLVTGTDVSAALNFAYSGSQTALINRLNQLRGTATAASGLADAMSAAATADVAMGAAWKVLNASPAAVHRLQLTQLYVALLGRNATNPPDAKGMQFYTEPKHTPEEVVASFLTNDEGKAVFPPTLGNAEFVDKVVAQVLGNATLVSASQRASWVARLSATPAQPRSKVALDIVNSVLNYSPNGIGITADADYLTARAGLLQRVNDAFIAMDTATAAEIAGISGLRATLKSALDQLSAQLAPLQTAMTNADGPRGTALSAATAALDNANSAGDGTAKQRLLITRMYATLLKRTEGKGPTLDNTNYYLKMSPEEIAHTLINSEEGKAFFPSGSDDGTFITQLYWTILNRPPVQKDIDYYTDALRKSASNTYARGLVAAGIVKDFFVNYTDNTPDQLTYRKGVDDRVKGFISAISTEATAASSSASGIYAEAKRRSDAVDSALAEQKRASRAVTNAKAAYDEAQKMLQLPQWSVTAVEEVYASLRGKYGSIDYEGALFWMKDIASGATTMENFINKFLDKEAPADPTAFVKWVFEKALDRVPSQTDWDGYVANVRLRGRYHVATEIMYSPNEGRIRISERIAAADYLMKIRANADIKKKTKADDDLTLAETALSQARRDYANYSWTMDSALSYALAQANVADTMTRLATAHQSVITADGAFLTYSKAQQAYNAKKTEWDTKNGEYQTALNTPVAQYQAALDLGATIRAATGTAAIAAKALPAVVLKATPENVQAQQLTQLYFTLLDRAPTLPELYFAAERMAGKATLTDIAATLLSSSERLSRYPANQVDEAFVRQFYDDGLERVEDNTGMPFYLAQLASGVSRAELAARFVRDVNAQNNPDTTRFGNRAASALNALSTTTVTTPMVDTIINAGAELARQKTAAFDASAAAALAASPEAQRTTQLTRLYVTILNRTPDRVGLNFYAGTMRDDPAMTMEKVAQLILDDAEAQRLLPSSLSAANFVDAVFRQAMGRTATTTELAQFANMLPGRTRGQVVCSIIDAVLAYQGTDRLQLTTQLGFVSKMSAALNEVAGMTAADDLATQAALPLLERVYKDGVRTLNLSDPVIATANVQQGSQSFAGPNLITVDRWGNIVAMADKRDPNFRITYEYNHDNQLTSQTSNARVGDKIARASTRYDALGRVVAQVDYKGNQNTTRYDSEGNVTSEYHADGGVVKSTYNLFGGRLSVQQPDTLFNGTTRSGVLTAYSYDHLGHLTSTTIGTPVQVYKVTNGGKEFIWSPTTTQQLVQRFTYDELGRQIRNTATDGVSTVLEYDLDGNVIATATQEVAGQSELLYRTVAVFDAQHQKIATRNANNDTMSWVYENGRLVSMVDMGGITTWYGYDGSGRLITQTSGRGQDLRYTFTGANLTRIEDAATKLTTNYTYDANGNRLSERQQYTGAAADAPPGLQNNTLRYDAQNRLIGIKDDAYTLTYEYDANGNRTKITTQYGTTTLQSYNAYDVMNRQTVVNGDWEGDPETGKAVFGQHGHAITYDKSGNRITDTFKGVAVSVSGGVYGTTQNQQTTEYYTYDGAGRLESTRRDVLTIDVRRYDAAGRITQSGLLASTLPGSNGGGAFGGVFVGAVAKASFGWALEALDIKAAGRIYSYDVGGHITRQRDLNAKLDTLQDTYFVKDKWNPEGGYDAMGNLIGYVVGASYRGRYVVEYAKYDTYKELKTTLASTSTSNISHYDVNGNRISINEAVLELVGEPPVEVDGAIVYDPNALEKLVETGKVLNRMWYDADGHIQSHTADGKSEFNLIVNGQVYGTETKTEDNILGSNYLGVTSPTLAAAPSSYSVQSSNETLQGIAHSLWGDANLWYLIADANALSPDAKLTPGQILRIPERVNTVHGDYGTYKPYDPTEQIGSTAPVMPPPRGGDGCGGWGVIVMVVVAVAVTAITGVPLLNTFGPSFLGKAAAYAAAGALGSTASQVVGMAIGAQDGFSWKAVGTAALSNMITGGIVDMSAPGGTLASIGGKGIPATMARAALASTVTQSIAVATGLQDHFSWRNVAASAVGAGVGAQVGDMLAQNEVFSSFLNGTALKVARGTVAGFAAGTASAIARGGRIQVVQVAADAFGNALGRGLVPTERSGSARADNMPTIDSAMSFSDAVATNRDNPFESSSAFAAFNSDSGVPYYPPALADSIYDSNDSAFIRGIGRQDAGYDRQTALTYADDSMVPVVQRTTNRMWALGAMLSEEAREAAAIDPSETLRQANDMAWAPRGTIYESDRVWTTLGLVEATKARTDLGPEIKSQLTSAWRDLYQRGASENVIRPAQSLQSIPAQLRDDALSAFGGTTPRFPRLQNGNVIPSTTSKFIPFDWRRSGEGPENIYNGQQLKMIYRQSDMGLPDITKPERLYGLSMKQIASRFEADGYDVRNAQTRTKTASEVYAIERHPDIAKIQRTENGSAHDGLYYKYTLHNGEELKVIDPARYGYPGSPKPGKFYAPDGTEIYWNAGWQTGQ